MKKNTKNYRWHTVTISALLSLFQPSANAQTWTQSPTDNNSAQLQWTRVEKVKDTDPKSNTQQMFVSPPLWKAAEPDQIILTEAETTKSVKEKIIVYPQSGTTLANDKALWRDDTWHPQISGTVPIGFGPKGLMISGSFWAIDCITGAGYCEKTNGFDEYRDLVEQVGDAQYNLSIGFGDSEKLVGLTVTTRIEETRLPFGDRNTQDLETDKNILDDYYVGVHLSKNIGPDTAIKFGIDNWLDIRECIDCGFAKSAYGVISQRFRLRDNQNSMFPNAYLTFGVGNGQFRQLDELVLDGIRKQRDAGCATPGFTPDKPCSPEALTRASLRARSYGQINPIGAIALEAVPGMNLIGEWSGRNLNAGFSVRPFEDLGLVFTGMWENLLPNCDYGCTVSVSGVPDGIDLKTSLPEALTQRPRFSFQASLELKF